MALVVAVMMVMMVVVGRHGRCHRRRRPVLTGAVARRYASRASGDWQLPVWAGGSRVNATAACPHRLPSDVILRHLTSLPITHRLPVTLTKPPHNSPDSNTYVLAGGSLLMLLLLPSLLL